MSDLGYGKGYRYVHDDPQAQADQAHLPEALKGKQVLQAKAENSCRIRRWTKLANRLYLGP